MGVIVRTTSGVVVDIVALSSGRRVLEIVRSLSAGTADSVAVTKRIDWLPGVVSVAIADRKSKIENHAAGVVQW
jgi:hypothetical protein